MNATPTPPSMTGEEERAAIVAWLRDLAGQFITPPVLCFVGDPGSRDPQLACIALADAIERGDHIPTGEER